MKAGNAIRRLIGSSDAVVRLALVPIHETRKLLKDDPAVPAELRCFIINSLKRREEADTLRTLFGDRFFMISVYEPRAQRIDNLCLRIARSRKSPDQDAYREVSKSLIDIDQKERLDDFGQRLGYYPPPRWHVFSM
jgi:hypothetical protein